MQFKLSTILPVAAFILSSVSPVLSDGDGVRAPPGIRALSHKKLARSYKSYNVQKREISVPGTFYNILMGEVACGGFYHPHDYVVAINTDDFGGGSACGKTITISHEGRETQATVRDLCPTCGRGGIDMTQGLFEFFAPTSVGLINVDWWFGGSKPAPSPTHKAPPPPTTTWHPPTTTYTTTTTKQWTSSTLSTKSSSSSATPSATPVIPTGSNNIVGVGQIILGLGKAILAAVAN